MKKNIKIQIPEPCHEDWNKMTPTQKGRFCKVCTKEVIDFSKTNDEDLVKKVMQGEKLCGRFKASQLNREMKLERKTGVSFAPLAASFLLPLTMLATNLTNKTNTASKMQGKFVSIGVGSLNNKDITKVAITTHGKIKNKDGKPIVGVKISIKETGETVYSNDNGAYKIVSSNDETLIIEKEGFAIQEIKLGRKSSVLYVVLTVRANEIKIVKKKGDVKKKKNVRICGTKISLITKGKPIILKDYDSTSKTKKDSLMTTVSGTVSDDFGIPLLGVNIIIKGTTIGTQSDFDGNYSLEAKNGQTLVFSYVGFKTEEIEISNNNINTRLEMNEDISLGVIVVGHVSVYAGKELLGYEKVNYDHKPTAWRKKVRQSLKNEKVYAKLNRAKKKVARLLKRETKRKN